LKRTIRATIGLRALVVAAVLLLLMVSWMVVPTLGQRIESALVAALFGVCAIPSLLLATTKIVVDGDVRIALVNMWTIVTIPLSEVASLSSSNGFEVVLRSGRRETASAIASSLIGTVARYPSAKRAIRDIEHFLNRSLSTLQEWQPSQTEVTRRIRFKAIGWGLLYSLFVGAVAYVIAGLVP
jgi:hypothetical protein